MKKANTEIDPQKLCKEALKKIQKRSYGIDEYKIRDIRRIAAHALSQLEKKPSIDRRVSIPSWFDGDTDERLYLKSLND